MASATATAKPDRAEKLPGGGGLFGSRLGRLIIALNLLGLAILISGALVLNELRRGLVNARIDSLTTQGELIANVIDRAATVGEPEPALEPERASDILQLLFIPRSQRARLFDAHGRLIADSYVISDRVEWKVLPPARKRGEPAFNLQADEEGVSPRVVAQAKTELNAEVAKAVRGQMVSGMRRAANGERVVSVSVPIQHVKAVLGVLVLEASDVDEIIARERMALAPFILIAILVMLFSSILLNRLIARPVRRLAYAADRVTLSSARAISLPDLAERKDEIGDLTRSLETMTDTLSERMDAIESFAADVAHEIRNPLTSIRSAIETLDLVKDAKPRQRLMGILKQDVQRLDRLVTDISNASRLDAELSREAPRMVDVGHLLFEICALYEASAKQGEPHVRYLDPHQIAPVMVSGREGPLGQVFRNLIDNARSFSPPNGEVRVSVTHSRGEAVICVDDDGPGIPPENLETVFERFYTSRPKGAAFGGNSGLGLSIARQIVEAHGGTVHAENRPEGGARFVVELPERKS